ncbi:Fatty acid synthesis protein, partial [Acidaminobacter hydrogenoformans DSM 2784]
EVEVKAPEKEVVTGSVSGIDIMDLEDAVKVLWKAGIYAESGMGCTGPIVMVAEDKLEISIKVLADAGYVSKEADPC